MNTPPDYLLSLKLAIKLGIKQCTAILQYTPEELLKEVDRSKLPTDGFDQNNPHNPEDAIYIIEQLQECLNNLLDARKRLILLGFYKMDIGHEKRISRKQEVQIPARAEIPQAMEIDEDPNFPTAPFPPDEEVAF